MRAFSKVSRKSAVIAAAIGCLMLAGSVSAFAVPVKQVARVLNIQEFTAQCCVPVGPTVQVNEPSPTVPVIVTWSTDYVVADTTLFELSLNGGPCAFYGSGIANIAATGTQSQFVSGTFQWAILPTDGLRQGLNSFTVCAGGVNKSVKMDFGSNVLAVRISK